jgi:hypothetical protein
MLASPEPDWGYAFWKRARRPILRAFKRQLELHRQYTRKPIDELFHALRSEMEFRDQKMIDRLEQIDTSLSLIAREVARRADDGR